MCRLKKISLTGRYNYLESLLRSLQAEVEDSEFLRMKTIKLICVKQKDSAVRP